MRLTKRHRRFVVDIDQLVAICSDEMI